MEEIYVLNNKNFENEGVLDSFESFIWTDRYSSYGDFEIYTNISLEHIELLQQERILWIKDTEHQMIIEEIKTESDVELGHYLTVTGRSLESILCRRIIWNKTILKGNLQDGIERLLNENIIKPSMSSRKIENFIFQKSDNSYILEQTFEGEFNGDELYEVIKTICDSVDIGFKIYLNDDNQFVFTLYQGIDRSYNQENLPYVVFSPSFDNIINSNYINSTTNYKNITLVAGEEKEDEPQKTIIVGDNTLTGLSRRELYTDARDISKTDPETKEEIPSSEYEKLLKERGEEEIKKHKLARYYDGEVDTTREYVYGRDFYMGDIIQLENSYNISTRVRIIEYIYSIGKTGILEYPTFEFLDEEDEKEE